MGSRKEDSYTISVTYNLFSMNRCCSKAITKQTIVNESNVSWVTRESFVTSQLMRMVSCVLIVLNLYIESHQEQADKFVCNIYQLTWLTNELWWPSPPLAACGPWKVDISGNCWGHTNRTKRNMYPIKSMQTNGRIFYRQNCFSKAPLFVKHPNLTFFHVFGTGEHIIVCILKQPRAGDLFNIKIKGNKWWQGFKQTKTSGLINLGLVRVQGPAIEATPY